MFFGSAYLHFVVSATNLQEEYASILQIMSILYLHPLAMITLYVSDISWFVRHHYPWYIDMKTAGYFRHDVMDPGDFQASSSDRTKG